MDVLTDVLNTLELKGWLSSCRELASPWRYEFVASQDSMFHVLSYGHAYLHVDGESEPIRVSDGDVVLFPGGHAHALYDEPLSPVTRVVQMSYDSERDHQVVHCDGEKAKQLLLCGVFHFVHSGNFSLLHSLPKLIHIRGVDGQVDEGVADIVGLITRESVSSRPGDSVMLRRLTELLFIQVIRLWIAQQAEGTVGWVGALRDGTISEALRLIHGDPAHPWTVNELAETVALSRSAFSARFSALVGEPPLTYLTRWRMLRATHLLKNDVGVATIAESLGYASEAAFRKAFKREIGMPPAAYRRFGSV